MDTNNLYPRFSETEFAQRYAAVRAAMQTADLPVLLVYGTPPFMNADVQYLSNYPTTWEAFLIFPGETDPEPTLFVQMHNHIPTARRISSISDVHGGGANTAEATVENVKKRGLGEGRIGLVGVIPIFHYETLRRGLPRATFVDFNQQMLHIRLVKSDEEIAALRKGAEFCDLAIEALEREARPGITEHQLAAIVQSSYLGVGGQKHHSLYGYHLDEQPACLCACAISIDARPRKG